MRTCSHCGHGNGEGASLCMRCGQPLLRLSFVSDTGPGGGSGEPVPPDGAPPESAELPPPPARSTPPDQPSFPSAFPPPGPAAYGPPAGMAPLPFPAPELSTGQKTGRYFIGIGLGFVPLLVLVAILLIAGGLGANGNVVNAIYTTAIYAPCLLELGALGLMIYFLTQQRFRFIGYGMLTVLVALPVIAAVACIVLISQAS